MANVPTMEGFARAGFGGGAPSDWHARLALIVNGARGALRAGREVERLMALSDDALARQGLTRDGIVAEALRRHLGE